MTKYLFSIFLFVVFFSCNEKKVEQKELKSGRWYGEFITDATKIPFVFEVYKQEAIPSTNVAILNGSERFVVDTISYQGDTVNIYIKEYDTRLQGVMKGDSLIGVFQRLFNDKDPGVKFIAVAGNKPRFEQNGSAQYSLAGKWDIEFISENETKTNVGIFELDKDIVTGSILTNSGDYRYLEGVNDADGFRLSSFTGLSSYQIEGKFLDQDNFQGQFISTRGTTKIQGKRNDKAALSDSYSITKLKDGENTLNFNFPNVEGKEISLSDPAYKGKVVVISILGTWCPNCVDEMGFLAPWYKANKDRGVEVIGLAFERKDDPVYVKKVLSNLIRKYNTEYQVLFAGKLGQETTALPSIEKINSYPTTIFVDKKGIVRKIHSGFSGPATGSYYEEFKREFNKSIDELLAE